MIVDEAHNAYRTDGSFKRLGELIAGIKRRYLLLLTATPVRHDIRELFSLISLVRPGEFKSLQDFEARVADPLQADSSRQAAIGRLNNVLSHVMVRQHRRDIRIPWPVKRVYRQVVALEPNDRRLREAALTAARAVRGMRTHEFATAAYSSPQSRSCQAQRAPSSKQRQAQAPRATPRREGGRAGDRLLCASRDDRGQSTAWWRRRVGRRSSITAIA